VVLSWHKEVEKEVEKDVRTVACANSFCEIHSSKGENDNRRKRSSDQARTIGTYTLLQSFIYRSALRLVLCGVLVVSIKGFLN